MAGVWTGPTAVATTSGGHRWAGFGGGAGRPHGRAGRGGERGKREGRNLDVQLEQRVGSTGDTKAKQATRCLRPRSRGRSELETRSEGRWHVGGILHHEPGGIGLHRAQDQVLGAPTLSCPTAQASGEGVRDL